MSIGGDTLGARLRYALSARDMTAAQLAERIGVRPSRMSEWVNDRGRPADGNPTAIARELSVSRRWLTVGHGDPFDPDSTAPNSPVEDKLDQVLGELQEIRRLSAAVDAPADEAKPGPGAGPSIAIPAAKAAGRALQPQPPQKRRASRGTQGR